MYQKLILIGNLGREPETRFTPNGDAWTFTQSDIADWQPIQ
jgi:single-stranded DNA-binding protein